MFVNDNSEITMNMDDQPCIKFKESWQPIAEDVHNIVVDSRSGSIRWNALRALAERDVFVYGVDITGQALWTVVPKAYTLQGKLRLAQFRSVGSEAHLQIARAFVDAKVAANAKMLYLAGLRDSDEPPQPQKKLDTLTKLRLWEGAKAAEHFEALGKFFYKHDLKFDGRETKHHQNRAAKQLSNALLNYSYGICASYSRKAVLSTALDPSIGWLHVVSDNQEAAVYDAQELLRFICDAAVINLVRQGKHYDPDGYEKDIHFTVLLKKPLKKALVMEMTRLLQLKAPFRRDKRITDTAFTYETLQEFNLERLTKWLRTFNGELDFSMQPTPELFEGVNCTQHKKCGRQIEPESERLKGEDFGED
jgi:CRISPR-associated endonuclease Cas1